jgi:seryl-tRNA synthetase
MIDIKLLRNNFDEIKQNIDRRHKSYPSLEIFKAKDTE